MQPVQEEKEIKVPTLIQSFAIIVILLFCISSLNITVRYLFGSSEVAEPKTVNFIFDQDIERNWTKVCPLEASLTNKIHVRKWHRTPCHNKTLKHWIIPWQRIIVWKKLEKIIQERKRLNVVEEHEENIESQAQNVTPVIETKVEPPGPAKESVIYTILTAVTLMLAILAGLEFFREKLGKQPEEEGKGERRCSLAEFTIKRHLRKESQQDNLHRQAAFDEPKKVKSLLHQGSLDRAMSKLTLEVSPRLPRQSSMPVRSSSSSSQEQRPVPNLQNMRLPSVDQQQDDGSPGMRRKSRHFIRRH